MTPEINYLEQRYREAWLTSRRLRSGIHLGHGSGWPEMIYDQREQIRRAETLQPCPAPTMNQEDQLMECIRWLTPLVDDDRKLIWLRASGIGWREIAKRTGEPRSSIHRHWHRAILQISLRQR